MQDDGYLYSRFRDDPWNYPTPTFSNGTPQSESDIKIIELTERISTLKNSNSEHINRIHDLENIVDVLESQLKTVNKRARKIDAILGSVQVNELNSKICEIFIDECDDDEIRAIINKLNDFMEYGNPQTLAAIPDKYFLRLAALNIRYVKVTSQL